MENMMRKIVVLTLSFVCVAPVVALAQEYNCSAQTLNGEYIFAGRGFIEPGEPGVQRVRSGVLIFDGAGNVAGKQSSSRGGNISRDRLQGTYALDANCSGTATFGSVAKPGSQIHWDLYVARGGKTGHMVRMDDGSMAVRTFQKE
ncbi:hypothetical protein P3T32_003421 [Ralstonia sp. GP73]|jgi:hypothetical protein|nr:MULTISPECIES: hypothetical protein [Ralstonia]MBT2179912.1 hypothetical protein [Ralstonia pickettii]MDH6643562.1 hypothetical protein [Ralstonia sp. GP73]OCS51862.1 hypothetical protein BEK68_04275 [Ralstonia pickettii]